MMCLIKNNKKLTIVFFFVIIVGLLIGSSGHALETKISIPLHVINRTDTKDQTFPVSAGIPFPEGLIFTKDLSELAVFDDQGNQVPSQFDPFVLWWGKDRSIKWMLVDMMASINKETPSQYFLSLSK